MKSERISELFSAQLNMIYKPNHQLIENQHFRLYAGKTFFWPQSRIPDSLIPFFHIFAVPNKIGVKS
jgi:hypothetical protein